MKPIGIDSHRQVGRPVRPASAKVAALVLALLVARPWPPLAQAQLTCTLTQITNTIGGSNTDPTIDADGTRIAFRSTHDLTPGSPGNADGNTEVFLFDTTSGFTQITNTIGNTNEGPSINAAGTRIALTSRNDLTGGNPDLNLEVFLFDTTTSGFTQITNTTGGNNGRPSINAAGTRIAFPSSRDLTPGTPGNADGNNEIFLFDTASGFTQVTNTTLGGFFSAGRASISADGTRIAFLSNRDLVPGGNLDGNMEIFLFDTATGLTQITNTVGGFNANPEISADGTRIAFYSTGDPIPGNPGNADGNTEIFVATCPGGSAPVEVSIDIKPGSDRNRVNPRSHGRIRVAILTTDSFDASTVDPSTVEFGPNGATPVQSRLKDVDGDGDLDLVLRFRVRDTGIACGDTSASLTGETTVGQAIEGSDAIKTVGCKKHKDKDKDEEEDEDEDD